METASARSLERVLPRLRQSYIPSRSSDPAGWASFENRLHRHFPALFEPLLLLYGGRYDFFWHLEQILELAATSWADRPAALRELDAARETEPAWFQGNQMLVGVCYVDLWAGNLSGIRAQIPYFRELGLTYLHLMPLFTAPSEKSDGGYAVSSYREVNPSLGTMAELADLAAELRRSGISLVLDFVFNHTSDEHAWAVEARQFPDDEERNAYLMFPDRTLPDLYDATLREIFPDQRPGSFTWVADAGQAGRWVWTTFNSFQWDLNYASPTVFRRMAGEMLFLANQGVEILRLDAVAFIWKRLGSACESLPEAHLLVQAYNAVARIAAPALLFKSEAIVHPAEVASYIDPAECQLSYNPLLMALLWETLATRDTRLLRRSMQRWFAVPDGCAWVNYVRSHDDIGWTFDDADAAALGINGYDHRRFLNRFYTGRFPGSFARGVPFQENPRTGDARISGTTASLAGLEKALHEEGPAEIDLAIRRILLLYGVVLAIGGLPLIYLGDELATLNDASYATDPARAEDSRWVHRPTLDPELLRSRHDPTSLAGRVFSGLLAQIQLRVRHPVISGGETKILDIANHHLFAFSRGSGPDRLLFVANMSEAPQRFDAEALTDLGSAAPSVDLATGAVLTSLDGFDVAPYQLLWIVPASGPQE